MRLKGELGSRLLRCEPQHSTPVADSITYFTRAMGSARSGDLEELRGGILSNCSRSRTVCAQSKDDYWAQQVEIQRNASNRLDELWRR